VRLAAIACLGFILCGAQEPVFKLDPSPADGSLATFGVTVVDSSGLQGQVYLIREGSFQLPNFKKLKPIGVLYTSRLNIPPRSFTEGFPGITNRFEWFAIDYTGRFWIERPGKYRLALHTDDGSKLYIDNKTVIDNDGVHPPTTQTNSVKLSGGVHSIRISYFQGPRTELALILGVAEEGEKQFRVFDTRDFRPPKDLGNWKFEDK
jgi:PA14 domain